MAIPWATIRSVSLTLGPFLIPRVIAYYRSSRENSRSAGVTVRPAPRRVRHAISLLLFVALVLAAFATLPPLAPENLFRRTDSRLQIPTDVLFARVATLRPGGALTAADEALRARFVNLESRLLYLRFGPDALASCAFCVSDEPRSYLCYAVPALLWAHLANFFAVAAATSPVWTGRYGRRWRGRAALAALTLAALDLWALSSYDHQGNARATRLADLDAFYWGSRATRLWALAVLDALVAAALWLTATNRAFVELPSVAERLESVNRALQVARGRMSALGIVKNTAQRDAELRGRSDAYWTQEVRLMAEAMEEREVIECVSNALENRVDIQTVTRDADSYTSLVLQDLTQE